MKLNDLSISGTFDPTPNPVIIKNKIIGANFWMDKIKVPFTNTNESPRVDEFVNPIIKNAPNPFDL